MNLPETGHGEAAAQAQPVEHRQMERPAPVETAHETVEPTPHAEPAVVHPAVVREERPAPLPAAEPVQVHQPAPEPQVAESRPAPRVEHQAEPVEPQATVATPDEKAHADSQH